MELTVAVETKSKKRNIIFSESSIKLECETKIIINDYLPVVEDVRNDVVVVELC